MIAKDLMPQDITFDRECVEWVWENIRLLKSGVWPASRPSGYNDLKVYVQRGILRAPFETPVLVAAEVEIRARKCGLDGYLVEDKYLMGFSEDQIARLRHMRVEDIARRINKVLWYSASGRKQRQENYQDWKKRSSYNRQLPMRIIRQVVRKPLDKQI